MSEPAFDPESPALRRTQRAIALLFQSSSAPGLAQLAAHAGISAAHFQREFSACTGLSPKRFAQVLAKERLLQALREGLPVLEAALQAGLSGPGRAHELLLRAEGLTPGAARRCGAGLEIVTGLVPSALGPVFAAWTGEGLCALEFVDEAAALPRLAERLREDWPAAHWRRDDALLKPLVAAVLRGEAVPAHLRATHFRLRVWQALMQLPPGRLLSYRQLAQAIGLPRGARAVAGAVAANPLAVLIPCHRVIREQAGLAGYRWGLPRKAMLIAAEQAAAS
jgi:AraC family transcriptional regulator of adaptative response/methylated-DNA-[protein]-cysteine methyltransferase